MIRARNVLTRVHSHHTPVVYTFFPATFIKHVVLSFSFHDKLNMYEDSYIFAYTIKIYLGVISYISFFACLMIIIYMYVGSSTTLTSHHILTTSLSALNSIRLRPLIWPTHLMNRFYALEF